MYYILMDAWKHNKIDADMLDKATKPPFNWITEEQAAYIKTLPQDK